MDVGRQDFRRRRGLKICRRLRQHVPPIQVGRRRHEVGGKVQGTRRGAAATRGREYTRIRGLGQHGERVHHYLAGRGGRSLTYGRPTVVGLGTCPRLLMSMLRVLEMRSRRRMGTQVVRCLRELKRRLRQTRLRSLLGRRMVR